MCLFDVQRVDEVCSDRSPDAAGRLDQLNWSSLGSDGVCQCQQGRALKISPRDLRLGIVDRNRLRNAVTTAMAGPRTGAVYGATKSPVRPGARILAGSTVKSMSQGSTGHRRAFGVAPDKTACSELDPGSNKMQKRARCTAANSESRRLMLTRHGHVQNLPCQAMEVAGGDERMCSGICCNENPRSRLLSTPTGQVTSRARQGFCPDRHAGPARASRRWRARDAGLAKHVPECKTHGQTWKTPMSELEELIRWCDE